MSRKSLIKLFLTWVLSGCSILGSSSQLEEVYLYSVNTENSIRLETSYFDPTKFKLGYASHAKYIDIKPGEDVDFNGCSGDRKIIRFVQERGGRDHFYIFKGIMGKNKLGTGFCTEIIQSIRINASYIPLLLNMTKQATKNYTQELKLSDGNWIDKDTFVLEYKGSSIAFANVDSNRIKVSLWGGSN